MANAAKTAARSVIDYVGVAHALRVPAQTVTALQTFRKRFEDMERVVSNLQSARLKVDFDAYRRELADPAVVDRAERAFGAFKPRTLDTKNQLDVIRAYEARAVRWLCCLASAEHCCPRWVCVCVCLCV